MPRREPRHQRQFAAGVGPRRHCKNVGPEPMPLISGDRLGSYEIIGPLGAGGMDEVYRARDTKLNRDVALEVIPDTFALDPMTIAMTLDTVNCETLLAIV